MATGGYPATTADNAPRPGLQCPHCELFLKEAVQTSEGLRLCRSCFIEIRRSVEEKIMCVQRMVDYCFVLLLS